MQQSYRSPRQPVRTRTKPYTRRQPPPRSGSILATIRNIVTAPLSWFSTTDEFEDTPGKRRRVLVPQLNADALDEHRSVKRQKVASPPPQPQGYLDPPPAMFRPHPRSGSASQDPTAFPSASMNVNTQKSRPDKFGRHSLAVNIWSRRDHSREVSMDDLPNRLIARDATMIPLPVSREASLSSVPRESSVGPVRAPFRMRTTLSPIPVGSDYGPNPRRRERDPSEPPPLTALMSNPIFVKPPPNQPPTHRSQSAQPTTTLGALTQTSRTHNRVSPRESSLRPNDPFSSDALLPVNASEIALSELAIYRTPLLPTRLRGSEAIPEMFKPKKVHSVVPMKSGKRDLPRLGTGRKKEGKKEDTRKPYSAHGGVKKLLQRRRMEEEVEKEHADRVMDTTDLNAGSGAPPSSSTAQDITSLPEPEVPQHRVYARETSSLRVGRSRMNRGDRPAVIRPSRTKFSAAFEDDDPVDQKEQEVQRSETKPMFEPPKDFTFSRDTTSVADFMPLEPTKESPIAALPFSLTPEPSKSGFLVTPAIPTPQHVIPVISLSPPTPQRSESSPGIPNFFANSLLLTRTPERQPPSGNLFGASPAKENPKPILLVAPDQTPASPGKKDYVVTSGPPEKTQSIPTPLAPPVTVVPAIPLPPVSIFTTPPMKTEVPEPAPTSLDGDPPKPLCPTPAPLPSTRPSLNLFGGSPSHDPAPVSTNVQTPSTTATMQPNPVPTSSEQKGPTSSLFSFGNSAGTPFAGFGNSTGGPKPFTPGQSIPDQSPGEPVKPPALVQSEAPKETKPGFSFTFKFGAPSTSPEKPITPQFGEPAQGASNSEVFAFGMNSNPVDTQKSLFGNFPRPVTPPREEEEVRMEESPTRVLEVATARPNENSFFAGRVLNFSQNNGTSSSPFSFGAASGDSNPFGSKLEKPKPSSGFGFGSSGSGSGFDQPGPAFTFGKVDNSTQPVTPSSPFTFGTSKLPDINTFGASQTTSSSPFNFGQGPESSQGSSGFAFTQQSPVNTNSPFNFGPGQTLAPPSFSQQQNGSVPNSPSTFSQSLSFGFGSATPTSTSNPFNFQSPSPITTTPSNAPGFAFGQQSQVQAQPSTPVSPFPVPGSPQPPGGSLFNIGVSPTVQSPGTRAIKKLPTRRAGARR